MPRTRGTNRTNARGARLSALLGVACAGLLAGSALATAQQTLALRGDIAQDTPEKPLIGGAVAGTDAGIGSAGDPSKPGTANSDTTGTYQPDAIGLTLRTTTNNDASNQPSSDQDASDVDDAGQDPFAAANVSGAAKANGTGSTGAADQSGDTGTDPDANAGTAKRSASAKRTTAAGQDIGDAADADITGTVPAKPIDAEDEESNKSSERTNQRAKPIEGLKRASDDDPYAALGFRAGGFILRPSLESGITATSNANSSPGGKGAILSESTLRLNAVSDWSENTASIDAFGTFRKSISGAKLSEPSAGIDAKIDINLGSDFVARGRFGYSLVPETASSPVFLTGTVGEPLTKSITGSLGLDKEVGKLRLGLTGNVERLTYGDAQFVGGGTASQHDRDSTLVSAILRAGYEISPAITPFVEGEIGRRYYDLSVDSSGYRRSADRVGARAGVALDFGDKLRGEVSAGFIQESPDDSRLAAISGPSLAASLSWSPLRGTTVSLESSTTVEGTTTVGESGSLLHLASLSVERQMRANLTGTASVGAFYRDYTGSNGHDFDWDAELSMTYWFNRYFGLVGRLRHEQLASNLPGRDYKTESVFLGVKLQR